MVRGWHHRAAHTASLGTTMPLMIAGPMLLALVALLLARPALASSAHAPHFKRDTFPTHHSS